MNDTTIDKQDIAVLQNLKPMYERMRKLKKRVLETEEAFAQAKSAYIKYAQNDLPEALYEAGLGDDNGNIDLRIAGVGRITCKRTFHCSPNKDDVSQQTLVAFLKEHDGEHLVKTQAVVDGAFISSLEGKVPYTESVAVNTSSLKAFIKNLILSPHDDLQMDEVPKCIHFCEVATADIELA